MKAVILAGGMGTRISEESHLRPKPMIEIGGRPILWHVMNIYTAHGVTDFIIGLGYRGYMIKEYFANYVLHQSDVTVDARNCEITYHTKSCRTVACHPGGHRTRHNDRRTHETGQPLPRFR